MQGSMLPRLLLGQLDGHFKGEEERVPRLP